MSSTMGPLRYTTAGADLSSTGQHLFIYLDSADSYKAKLLTDAQSAAPIGVLQNAPADNAVAEFRNTGLCKVIAGGAITPYGEVAVSSASKALAAIPGDLVVGRYIPYNTAAGVLASCAATDIVTVELFDNPYYMVGETNVSGSVVGYYKFATDGGAAGTIDLRDINGNDVTIPTGATILGTSYRRVTTTLTSGGAATIAFNLGGKALLAATAYNNAVLTSAINVEFLVGLDKTTAATQLQMVIADAALTAGELFVQIDYTLVTEGR